MSTEGAVNADQLIEELGAIPAAFAVEIAGLSTEPELRTVQSKFLGKKGRLSEVMRLLGRLSGDDRPKVGAAANAARSSIDDAISHRLAIVEETAMQGELSRTVDVTLPPRGQGPGTLHPLTLVRLEIEDVFARMGFEVRTGPWIETEWNNFDALNTPADHPARDMQDTFFVEGGQVLRSHTSPVQIRTMLAGPPPVRIIAPGNVFRRDDDATHTPMFPQIEGLEVGPNVSFADLKGTLLDFVGRFFGPATNIRLRPSFFPFTEPSAELDASCFKCDGKNSTCRLCKGTGWLEIGGCGMVHPNVFRHVGYDPTKVTGYAFGMGMSRMAMLKYGVSDLRLFYDNDVRFLQQFSQSVSNS